MAASGPTQRTIRLGLALVALVISSVGLYDDAGRLGIVVAVTGVAVAVVTAGFYGVAVHHLGVVALPDAPSLVGLVLLETAGAFLLAADAPPGRRLETGSLFVPVAVVLAVVTTVLAERQGFPSATVALAVVVGLGIYVLHRYAHARLGPVGSDLES